MTIKPIQGSRPNSPTWPAIGPTLITNQAAGPTNQLENRTDNYWLYCNPNPPRFRPIMFSGPMVRAIVSGQKTMTRRIVPLKGEHKPEAVVNIRRCIVDDDFQYRETNGARTPIWLAKDQAGDYYEYGCKYGDPGNYLWIRETHAILPADHELVKSGQCEKILDDGTGRGVVYQATDKTGYSGSWKPSIHMPRVASRGNLLIKSVRAERLNEISPVDALAEGVTTEPGRGPDPVEAFKTLWDHINGSRPGAAWSDNPWVFVVEFRHTLDTL